jgi:predicted nucleic acid-binding protein
VAVLLDTSVLVRLANVADKSFAAADHAIHELHRRGETLHVTPQNFVEFHNVATRPASVNGLGLSHAEALAKAAKFEAVFSLVAETGDIFPAWKSLVAASGVIGKRVHDARLVAVCIVHGLTQILTFNDSHFRPLSVHAPGINVLHPASV